MSRRSPFVVSGIFASPSRKHLQVGRPSPSPESVHFWKERRDERLSKILERTWWTTRTGLRQRESDWKRAFSRRRIQQSTERKAGRRSAKNVAESRRTISEPEQMDFATVCWRGQERTRKDETRDSGRVRRQASMSGTRGDENDFLAGQRRGDRGVSGSAHLSEVGVVHTDRLPGCLVGRSETSGGVPGGIQNSVGEPGTAHVRARSHAGGRVGVQCATDNEKGTATSGRGARTAGKKRCETE